MVIKRSGMDRDDKGLDAGTEALPDLRWLKALVIGLAAVMAFGMIAIVTILWLRLSQPMLPDLPANMTLPDGAQVQSLTFAPDHIVVVTQSGEVLLYDRNGALKGQLQP